MKGSDLFAQEMFVPTVKVIHNRRNIGHGNKHKKSGWKIRDYDSGKNSGDTAVQDANIRDIIPGGFDIERVTVRCKP